MEITHALKLLSVKFTSSMVRPVLAKVGELGMSPFWGDMKYTQKIHVRSSGADIAVRSELSLMNFVEESILLISSDGSTGTRVVWRLKGDLALLWPTPIGSLAISTREIGSPSLIPLPSQHLNGD